MPKLTISDLDRELRNKNLRPVYLIYGAESYLVNTALTRIRDYIAKIGGGGDLQTDRFSAKDCRPEDIINCARTIPMWSRHRLVVVSEAPGLKEAEALIEYLKRPVAGSTIVFTSDTIDGRTRLAQACASYGGVIECKPLYENQVPDWIRMETSSRGRSVSIEAAKFMAEAVGVNLGELSGAIEKLILYIGKKPVVDIEDVETVLTETSRRSVFDFANAVGSRDLARAFHVLTRLKEFRENEVMILSMLSRHWRLLLKAKEAAAKGEADMAAVLGVHPFFAKDYAAQSRLFKPVELKAGFKKLYTADRALKSSKLPKWLILERCVRELIS